MEIVETTLAGLPLSIESGRLARQASGSVLVRYQDSVVLVAAAAGTTPTNQNFLPLGVHYTEKMYAAGRIPRNFFRREGRPSTAETLISRFIDRPIRPLLPKTWRFETQIEAYVLSADPACEPAVAAMLGASAALALSDVPFAGPVAGVRVARLPEAEDYLLNPTKAQLEQSLLNFFVVGSEEAILMVEGEAKHVSEADALGAILFAHEQLQPLVAMQNELVSRLGRPKRPFAEESIDPAIQRQVERAVKTKLRKALGVKEKQERSQALATLRESLPEALKLAETTTSEEAGDAALRLKQAQKHFDALEKSILRETVLKSGKRIDGRDTHSVRPIAIELDVLPRAHGSALFTRGETQALVVATMGSREDEQLIDGLDGVHYRPFIFHYNFPSFSVGEARMPRGPGRREIGHGFLAERGIAAVLPPKEKFPYVVRVVSEILESNGSSSMASVCGASLAMMQAGVPLSEHVAGIAMGLIQEPGKDGEKKAGKVAILTDILGDEDHLGDMDFKVAGSRRGITALQMDIKIQGLDANTLEQALEQAREARLHILEQMEQAIAAPAEALSRHAPRLVVYKIAQEKIRDLIGPGGKIIKGITEKTGARVDVHDDGVVTISGQDHNAVEEALDIVKRLTKTIAIGESFTGPVKKVTDFGAFVELTPGTDGLVHISELRPENVRRVEDVINEGELASVRVIGFDRRGKLKLTMIDVDQPSAADAS